MMRPRSTRSISLLVSVLLMLGGCASPGSSGSGATIRAVATTTILGDFVAYVGGDRLEVHAIVPPGGEVHTFDPSPSDLEQITSADVIFANGLGLDEWVTNLVTDAGAEAPTIHLAEELDGVEYLVPEGDDAGDVHEDEHGHEEGNPHLWMNAGYAAKYVERIRDELTQLDPEGGETYAANAESYLSELAMLDAEIRTAFEDIAAEDRRLVSYHDAFAYFADAYGLEIVGTVTAAPGQDPSAGQVARLIDEIRELGVRAILAEAQFPADLAQRIAEETGIEVVSDLHSDSVGPPPNDTYLALMRADTERIAEALR
jgi:ABC-type Zn uptake system ZnuABC Zn-binding protein ZnuA